MARLGDVCEIVSGTTPKSNCPEYWDGEINWITPAEIDDDTKVIFESQRKITERAVKDSHLKPFPAGTVILSSRAPIGKVAIAGNEMYCNQGFKNLICSECIDSTYLFWFLKSKTEYLNSLGRGATFKEISKSIVEEIEIPLPPLDEQRRIAAILDKVTSLIALRKQQLALLDELVKARFVEMFGDLMINPMGWPLKSFSEFAEIDCNRVTDYEKYGDYIHVGIENIEKNSGIIKNCHTVRTDGIMSGKYLFTPAHIIYSKIRPNLNKVALPNFTGLCSADAYPILPITTQCNRIFLAYVMRSPFFLNYILQFCQRTNLPKVNKKEIYGFCSPIPPIYAQNLFADFVESVEKQRLILCRYSATLEVLKTSLMQKIIK